MTVTGPRTRPHARPATGPGTGPGPGEAVAKPRFRAEVEGLRAVAVLAVALDHAAVPGFGGGFVGVDVFFVISGFLITGLLVHEAETRGRISIGGFYARRVRRILPLSAFVLVLTVLASYAVGGSAIGNRVAADGAWASVFLANVHFAQSGVDYFNRGGFVSPLEHYWSLGVEEQFYVLWPLLILAIGLVAASSARTRRRLTVAVLVVLVVASLAWSVTQTASSPTAAYFSPFTRAWELGIGALLAVALSRGRRHAPGVGRATTVVGLGMLVASFVLIDAGTPFPSAWALLPVLGTAAVILGGELAPDGTLTGALGAGPMRYVGERSFGFYLWHQPFLVLPALALGSLALPGRLALLSLGFAAAVVTYELVENPVRHARRLARAVPLTLGVGGGLVAAGLVVTLGAQTLGKVEVQQTQVSAVEELPSPAEARRAVADSVGMQALPDDLSPPAAAIAEQGSLAPEEAACDRDYDVTQADLCLLGDPAGERTMVLWGDSHASMWAPGLSALAEQQGIRLAVFAKYGCAPLLDVTPWHPVEDRAYPECAEFKESVVPLMLDLDPDQVVLTGAFKGWAYTENGRTRIDGGTYDSQGRWTQTDTVDDVWDAGLERTLEALDPTGAPVTVLGDSAYPGEDPTTCFVANGASLTECATPQETAVWDQHNDSEQATAEAAGAAYVSTTRWFCAEDTCPPVVGSIGVYRDGYHVTRQFSLHLARALGEAIGVLPRTYGNR